MLVLKLSVFASQQISQQYMIQDRHYTSRKYAE